MTQNLKTLLIGGSGVGAVEVIEQAQNINPETISSGVGILSQIIILIATLVGLFKKKKSGNNLNQ